MYFMILLNQQEELTKTIYKMLEIDFLGNNLSEWLLFISIILFSFIIRKFISQRIIQVFFRLLNSKTIKKEWNQQLVKPINNIILIILLYVAFNQLDYPTEWELVDITEFGLKMTMSKGYSLVLALFIIQLFLKIEDIFGEILKQRASQTESKLDDQLIPFAIDSIKILTIILGVFIIIGNIFNVNITALAAGLGVGGIAIAMASKESLENLFGSFTIFLDRPFVVGDVVSIGNTTGVVEKVGFRSTRLRTFDQSLVTIPNKKMVDAELDNLGLRPVRRAKFYLGLTYETSKEQIKNIVADIQKMIDKHSMTNSDGRVKFMDFGASSLDIMVIFYVNSSNWDDFINTKEDINYKIMDIVNQHGSSFAFPSTSVYIEQNKK